MKHYKSGVLLSKFVMSSPLHKRKAPLLTIFWRRFSIQPCHAEYQPRHPRYLRNVCSLFRGYLVMLQYFTHKQ